MELTRRELLAAGVGGFSMLAGCSALNDSEPDTPTQYRLPGLLLYNQDETAHQGGVIVRRGDKIIHWSRYDILPRGRTEEQGNTVYGKRLSTKAVGGCEPGIYHISVRIDGGTIETFTFPEESGDGRGFLRIDLWSSDEITQASIEGPGDTFPTCPTPTPE